jgi:hypothetical protein
MLGMVKLVCYTCIDIYDESVFVLGLLHWKVRRDRIGASIAFRWELSFGNSVIVTAAGGWSRTSLGWNPFGALPGAPHNVEPPLIGIKRFSHASFTYRQLSGPCNR